MGEDSETPDSRSSSSHVMVSVENEAIYSLGVFFFFILIKHNVDHIFPYLKNSIIYPAVLVEHDTVFYYAAL